MILPGELTAFPEPILPCITSPSSGSSFLTRLLRAPSKLPRKFQNFTQQTQAPANRNARSKQWQPWLAACQHKRLRFLWFSLTQRTQRTQRKRLCLNGNRTVGLCITQAHDNFSLLHRVRKGRGYYPPSLSANLTLFCDQSPSREQCSNPLMCYI